jgi:hypothetical protein
MVAVRSRLLDWASSIIMASVRFSTTIGAGTAVVRPTASRVCHRRQSVRTIKEVCPDSREELREYVHV